MFGYFLLPAGCQKKAFLVIWRKHVGTLKLLWWRIMNNGTMRVGPLDPQGIPNAVTQPWIPDEASFAGTLLSKVGIGDPPLQTLLTTCLTPFSASRPSWHPLFFLFAALRPFFWRKDCRIVAFYGVESSSNFVCLTQSGIIHIIPPECCLNMHKYA